MWQSRLSGSVEGVMGNHDSYSDCDVRGTNGFESIEDGREGNANPS